VTFKKRQEKDKNHLQYNKIGFENVSIHRALHRLLAATHARSDSSASETRATATLQSTSD
jgi:hypothetical protein